MYVKAVDTGDKKSALMYKSSDKFSCMERDTKVLKSKLSNEDSWDFSDLLKSVNLWNWLFWGFFSNLGAP